MEGIKLYIKKHHISYSYLSKETGYSAVYFSVILNGHKTPSIQFLKLLIAALTKYAKKDMTELRLTLESTPWKSYMPR